MPDVMHAEMEMGAGGVSRRRAMIGAALSAFAFDSAVAQSQGLRIVAPFSAGTVIDAMARRLAEALSLHLPERPVVMNRDGASGTLAFAELAQSPADGSSVIFGAASPLVVHPHLRRDPKLDPADYRPVCQMFEQPLVLVVSRRLELRNVADLVELAKKRAGALKFGHYGLASATHIELLGFARTAGVDVIEVPYRAHGQLVADLASGALDAAISTPGTFDTGVIQPLMLIAGQPIALYPDLPTSASLGFPPALPVFGGVFARAGTSDETLARLTRAFRAASEDPDFQATARRLGALTVFADGDAFTRRIKEESLRVQALLGRLGLVSQ